MPLRVLDSRLLSIFISRRLTSAAALPPASCLAHPLGGGAEVLLSLASSPASSGLYKSSDSWLHAPPFPSQEPATSHVLSLSLWPQLRGEQPAATLHNSLFQNAQSGSSFDSESS